MSNVVSEQKVQIRTFKIDLRTNARITSPGSFKSLENLWSPQEGSLEQRPGGRLFCSKWVAGPKINPDDWFDETSVAQGIPKSDEVFKNPGQFIERVEDVKTPLPKNAKWAQAISGSGSLAPTVGSTLYDITF